MGIATTTFSSDEQPLGTTAATAVPVITASEHLWAAWFTVVDGTVALGRLLAGRIVRRDRARASFVERQVHARTVDSLTALLVLPAAVPETATLQLGSERRRAEA